MNPTPRTDGANRWLILGICCMSLFIVGLDVSALNLALPSIRADLHVDAGTLQWIIDAYSIVLASLLMLSGSLGDRFGRKRMFLLGLVLFGLGSLLCSFATTASFLIASRVLQAVGGSMLNPIAMSIVTATFRDPVERARAIGMWGASVGLSMALGPLVGGVLVETISWEAVFWMNVPVVAIAVVLTLVVIPESRAVRPRSLDPVGQALVMLALASLTYGIIEGRGAGWGSGRVVTSFVVAAVAFAAFVVAERRIREPLIDPLFFRSVPFSGAVVSAIVGFAAMSGFMFVNSLYLQSVRDLSPIHAGFMTLPMAACTAVMAPISGRLVASRGPRIPMVLAGVGVAASAVVLSRLEPATPAWVLVIAYACFGLGFGLLNAPITNSAVSGMPRDRAGVASGVASTSRQVGTALGVALFGTIAFSGAASTQGIRALAASSHPAWWLMFGCGVVLSCLGFAVTTRRAHASAARVSAAMEIEA